jgi:hypothetical protein
MSPAQLGPAFSLLVKFCCKEKFQIHVSHFWVTSIQSWKRSQKKLEIFPGLLYLGFQYVAKNIEG